MESGYSERTERNANRNEIKILSKIDKSCEDIKHLYCIT
jgi:hypothetical protein